MGRLLATLLVLVIVVFGVAWAFGFISLRQTQDARLPSVAVEGGQAPKFHIDAAKVNLGTRNESVSVPKVNVGTTEKQVEVPALTVDKPAK